MKKLSLGIFAIIALVVIVFVLDPFNFSGREITEKTETVIEILDGKITLNGEETRKKSVLKEGDAIVVLPESEAQIVFFDDSVSRLQAGTEVELKVLKDEDFDLGESHILLDLKTGEVWSNVQAQTGEDVSFQVQTAAVNATIRGTAFNIKTDGTGAEIQATEHSVIVENKNAAGEVIEETQLVEGNEVQKTAPAATLAVAEIPAEKLEKDWFKTNEASDKTHKEKVRKRVKKQQQRRAGSLPGTLGYQVKKVRENVSLALANEEGKKNLQLKIAEREFAEAQLLYEKGDADKAKSIVMAAEAKIEKIQKDDPKKAKQVKKVIQKTKRKLRQVLPDEDTYELKEALRELDIKTAPEEKKAKLKKLFKEREVLEHFDAQKKKPSKKIKDKLEKFEREGEIPDKARPFIKKMKERFENMSPEERKKFLEQESEKKISEESEEDEREGEDPEEEKRRAEEEERERKEKLEEKLEREAEEQRRREEDKEPEGPTEEELKEQAERERLEEEKRRTEEEEREKEAELREQLEKEAEEERRRQEELEREKEAELLRQAQEEAEREAEEQEEELEPEPEPEVAQCPAGSIADFASCQAQCSDGLCSSVNGQDCFSCTRCPAGSLPSEDACLLEAEACEVVASQGDLRCWSPKRSCEEVCADNDFQLGIPDFSSYIQSQLDSVQCVSGYQMSLGQARIGDCTCFVDEPPEIIFDNTVPVCAGTVCGDVQCGQSASCPVDEGTATVSCNWAGWQKTDVNQFVPIIGE